MNQLLYFTAIQYHVLKIGSWFKTKIILQMGENGFEYKETINENMQQSYYITNGDVPSFDNGILCSRAR